MIDTRFILQCHRNENVKYYLQEERTMTITIIDPIRFTAVAYGRQGMKVHPLHTPVGDGCSCGNPSCNRPGKHPRLRDWKLKATADPHAIAKMWDQFPNANIGVCTGAASGVFVLDVDGPEGRTSLRALRNGQRGLKRSSRVDTGRGWHYYLRSNGYRFKNSAGRLGAGLDIRGDDGLVVGVGSRHASGVTYLHASDQRHNTIPVPAVAPDWLMDEICALGLAEKIDGEGDGVQASYGAAALADEVARFRKSTDGTRNDNLNCSSFRLGQLVGAGVLGADEVVSAFTRAAAEIGLDDAEIRATIKSGLTAGKKNPRQVRVETVHRLAPRATETELDALAEELAKLGETDADNAERLTRRFGDRLAYTPGRGFLVFDGRRWQRDASHQRMAFAERTARAIAAEVGWLSDGRDKAGRSSFATASLSKGALDRMLDLARNRLAKSDAQFDAHPYLLNVENGTLDLRQGKLRPHSAEDLLTKILPVAHDQDANCPVFERVIAQALNRDEDLKAYFQRAVGYTLTGDTTEQVFFFVHGRGSTGKSTLINLIRQLLGDYGLHTPTETILAKQYDNAIPTDLARLMGARMVTVIEANWNRQIDEARLKAMTGGEPIAARFMRQDLFQFQPEFKLWFVANDPPGVRGTAESFWRRVHVLPFDQVVEDNEVDPELSEKLHAELPGILAWSVRGCLEWQRHRLKPPQAVRRATDGWKQKADHVRRFMTEAVVIESNNLVGAHDLYLAYRSWCERHGETPSDTRRFKKAMEGLDVTHKRGRSGSVWVGIRLRIPE
ncbi:phage/plasmid primase, P4 family [Methylobacterium sp. NEAU K]|uniref:phage/plasmid primase, P4 family n=1 Tax=Methylobacterium sp. NEAU K TaxID=3064946 RepID=UPI0027343C11|nr:phage/plasmid primase, P4 family [Methylobacterium sp. NEAU K]MDP4006688.1 phage/plasmid primase, P4 family [Methylobacterium sp. NEAU K]